MEDVTMSHWSPSDSEEELPLDLNPNMSARSAIIDVLFHRRSLRSSKPNYRDAMLASAPLAGAHALHQDGTSKTLPKDYIPPRPKPPIPAQFFIHLADNWLSMPKEVVRNHLVECFAVRDKYIDARRTWENEHNKWACEAYRLMRTVMKAQRRAAAQQVSNRINIDPGEEEAEVDEDDIETVLDELAEDDASQAATEFEAVDFENGSALTHLQEGAEADEQERVRRWFMSQFKRAENAGTSSRTGLPALRRAGPGGTFGLSHEGSGSRRTRRTPSFDLPGRVARSVPAHNIQTTIPPVGPGVCESGGAISNNSTSNGEEEDEHSHPWRIYSNKCSCGYADCHCHSWRSWWDKTHDMLAYVEYVDLPAIPGPEDLPGSPARFVRLYPGTEPPTSELSLRYDPSNDWDDSQTGRDWVYDRFAQTRRETEPRCAQAEVLDPRYFGRVGKFKSPYPPQKSSAIHAEVESNGSDLDNVPSESKENTPGHSNHSPDKNLDTSTSCTNETGLSSQHSPYAVIKLQWEGFIENDPKIPSEYSQEIFRVLIDELELACMPDWTSSGSDVDWHIRNRFVHWIAYAHYCCNLSPQTLFLSVNLMDRFLTKRVLPLRGNQWNVIAAACLWASWKFESSSHPANVDFVITYAEIGMVCKEDVILAEWELLRQLDHDLSYPGPLVFMRYALMKCGCTKEIAYLARFFVEVSLTLESMIPCRPSGTAAAAVWLARELSGVPGWTPELEHATTWKAHELYLPLTYIVSAILKTPRVARDRHDCSIFIKWADSSVSNLAHWCQDVFQCVWPDPEEVHFERDLSRLRELVQSRRIPPLQKINPGPPSSSPLFEL
ncbi:G2/mitotic-specific cyclin [Ceratobasidium sp. 414]|nr:G2/mitotic-specific cyclin [Ceratobasidium sp. 414]